MELLQKAEGLLQAVDQTAKAVSSGQQTALFGQGSTSCMNYISFLIHCNVLSLEQVLRELSRTFQNIDNLLFYRSLSK